MGKTLKKFSGSGYSSVEESQLGQVIKMLQDKLQALQQLSHQESSIEEAYAVKQLTAFSGILEQIQRLLSYYSNGEKPEGLARVPFGMQLIGLFTHLNKPKDFITAPYAFFKEIKGNLAGGIKKSLKGINQFTKTNSPDFKERLQKELKKNKDSRFTEARKIPGFNLENFFEKVDQAINCYNLLGFNGGGSINKRELTTKLLIIIRQRLFNAKRAFQISHQITYDFIVEALELFMLFPQNTEELLTFLNPSALNLNLKDAWFIPDSYAEFKILIEHKPTDTSNYRYKITESNGETATYNVKEFYNKYIQNILLDALAVYLRDYAESPHVKSEMARVRLIRAFIEQERNLDQICIDAAFNLTAYQVPTEIEDSETRLELLNTIIEKITQVTDLEQRKLAYEQKNFAELLQPHKHLLAALESDRTNKLDVSYGGLPLPDILVAKNDCGQLVVDSVKNELVIKDSDLEIINRDKPALLTKKAELLKEYEIETQKWYKQEILKHKLGNAQFLTEISPLVQAADALNNQAPDVELPLEIDAQIDALEGQVSKLAQQKVILSGNLSKAKDLQVQVNKPAACPKRLVNADSTIGAAVDNCYQTGREQAKACVAKLQDVEKILQNKEASRNNRLLKVRAAKVVAETIKLSDPKAIEQLHKEKKSQYEQLLLKQTALTDSIRQRSEKADLEKSHAELIQQEKELEEIIQEQSVLKTSISILSVTIDLLKGNQILNEIRINALEIFKIDFKTAEQLYKNQATITENINIAVNDLKSLEVLQGSLEKLVKEVDALADPCDYQSNVKRIESLLAVSREKIANFVQDIYTKKLDDLNVQISSSEGKLKIYSENYKQFTQNPFLNTPLIALNCLLDEYTVLSDEIKFSLGRSKLLQSDLANLFNEKLSQKITEATNQVAELDKTINNVQIVLLEHIHQYINGLTTATQNQRKCINIPFDECKATYANKAVVLKAALSYLQDFPSEQLKKLQSSLEKLDGNSVIKNLVTGIREASVLLQQKQVEQEAINEKLAKRISDRDVLVQRFDRERGEYLRKRNQQYKYIIKDRISSKDAKEREEFIANLQTALTNYVSLGNSEPVFACINAKKAQFFGFNLSPILNRLILDLKELDSKIPKQYDTVKVENTDIVADYHTQALQRLDDLKASNCDFVKSINLYYAKINSLSNYGCGLDNKEHGNVVKTLAAALQRQVDGFVVGNAILAEQPSRRKELFDDFQTNFMCQLHSQDDVMSQHTSFWKPFLVNLAFAMASLGFAIGIKLLASKVITGHASFFYRPEGLGYIDAIDEVATQGIAGLSN